MTSFLGRNQTAQTRRAQRARLIIGLAAAGGLAAPFAHGGAAQAASSHRWITVWAPASTGPVTNDPYVIAAFPNSQVHEQTIRTVAHVMAPGSAVRVRVTNRLGKETLHVGGATVALRAAGPAVQVGTNVTVRFGGQSDVVLAPGTDRWSDPVAFPVGTGSEVAISMYVQGTVSSLTWHPWGNAVSYVSPAATGNETADQTGATFHPADESVFFLDGLQADSTDRGTVVTLGDSLTDGFPVVPDQYQTWPDVLAQRLASAPAEERRAVVNAGIAGNQLAGDAPECGVAATARADHDALSIKGVSTVILFEGTNDLTRGVPAKTLIAALAKIAGAAHAKHLTVIGATLTPRSDGGANPWREANRQAINKWIRTTKTFDQVLDFDSIVKDPADNTRLNPIYDAGDHLHMNVLGLKAVGTSIDMTVIR